MTHYDEFLLELSELMVKHSVAIIELGDEKMYIMYDGQLQDPLTPDELDSPTDLEAYAKKLQRRRAQANDRPSYRHDVVVGNIGTVVLDGTWTEAQDAYRSYSKMSKEDYGRASGESVTWFRDSEPYKHFAGFIERQEAEDAASQN